MSKKNFNRRKFDENDLDTVISYQDNNQEEVLDQDSTYNLENDYNEIKESIEEPVQEEVKETNYLEIDKEPKENLNVNGLIFKHGTVIGCNTLNFRKNPNKLSDVIGTFKSGDEILYTETNDPDWFEVKDSTGKIGYCMSEFIKIEV